MLDELTPQEFDELQAMSLLVEPVTIADHFDRLAEILKLGFVALCRSSFAGVELTTEDFEPHAGKREKSPAHERESFVSPNQAAAWFSTVTGAATQWRPPAT